MDAIFINSENSKTSYPHRLLLNLSGKINLKISENIASSNFSIYYTLKSVKKSYKLNRFQISGETRNEKLEL